LPRCLPERATQKVDGQPRRRLALPENNGFASGWTGIGFTTAHHLEASGDILWGHAPESIGATTPLAAKTVSAATTQTGELGAQIATWLPRPTPTPRSPWATRSAFSATVPLSQLATPSSARR
jgi:hypothetical protein